MKSFRAKAPVPGEKESWGLYAAETAKNIASIDLSRLSVLLIDDNKFMRHLVSAILQSFGVKRICEAASADAAFKQMKNSTRFDLVICDWSMAPRDGLSILRRVRGGKTPLNPRIPFVMLTGECREDKVVEAMSEGVSSYIIKPISAKLLMNHLIKLMLNDRDKYELD